MKWGVKPLLFTDQPTLKEKKYHVRENVFAQPPWPGKAKTIFSGEFLKFHAEGFSPFYQSG